MQYLDSTGRSIRLSRLIGEGGEATIYRVVENPYTLAKIYKNSRPEYEKKLTWMKNHPPDDPSGEINHASIAWPRSLIYKTDRAFSGYLMPYIKHTVQLLHIFNPRLRKRTFPDFNDLYLHRTARNLAAAVGALHVRNYIVGDLNESNILVTPTTLVTLIDTDSFQVQAKNRLGLTTVYPCPVGKFEYLPPELQLKPLENVYREPEHDRFALAVLIFQLLMNGNHPYRAQWKRSGDPPPIERRINEGWFPYQQKSFLPVAPPANAPSFANIHPMLTNLFRRCFISGHDNPSIRPTPEEWEETIAQVEKVLVPCGKGHTFSNHLPECPHCQQLETSIGISKSKTTFPVPNKVPKNSAGITRTPSSIKVQLSHFTFHSFPTSAWRSIRPLFSRNLSRTKIQQNTLKLASEFLRGSIGKIILMGTIGIASGSLIGYFLGGMLGGSMIGSVGGLFSGAMVSEIIQKKVGWPATLGIIGAVIVGWILRNTNVLIIMKVVSILTGGLFGFQIGRLGKGRVLIAIWAVASAVGGFILGRAMGGAVGSSAAGGALSGGTIFTMTSIIHQTWRKFGN